MKKVFTTAGGWSQSGGVGLGIADQCESAEVACEQQSDTFRLSWQ
jgi:hypothetical protein